VDSVLFSACFITSCVEEMSLSTHITYFLLFLSYQRETRCCNICAKYHKTHTESGCAAGRSSEVHMQGNWRATTNRHLVITECFIISGDPISPGDHSMMCCLL